jgi:predicted ATPase
LDQLLKTRGTGFSSPQVKPVVNDSFGGQKRSIAHPSQMFNYLDSYKKDQAKMTYIEGIHIKNYRSLKNVSFGKTSQLLSMAKQLPHFMTFIGPNGCGKSTLMDTFEFIRDCLTMGVEQACDKPHRGSFERLHTRGQQGTIGFEINYRIDDTPITYRLEIDNDKNGNPVVVQEGLLENNQDETKVFFLKLEERKGYVLPFKTKEKIEVKLDDPQRLGIATLGNLAEHPHIIAFRQFLESWYLSYFVPDLARGLPLAGTEKHLNRSGNNLANYMQFMQRQYPQRFDGVLQQISHKIPGIEQIRVKKTEDGRLLLQFNDRGYIDPFYAQEMSDGTLKLFAYLLLLQDPEPHALIGIEEPENGLHHQLLEPLALEIKHVTLLLHGPQIILTTHSPYLIDALQPKDVWIMEKNDQGFSTVTCATNLQSINELHAEGIPMGSIKYSNHFGRGNPYFSGVQGEPCTKRLRLNVKLI